MIQGLKFVNGVLHQLVPVNIGESGCGSTVEWQEVPCENTEPPQAQQQPDGTPPPADAPPDPLLNQGGGS